MTTRKPDQPAGRPRITVTEAKRLYSLDPMTLNAWCVADDNLSIRESTPGRGFCAFRNMVDVAALEALIAKRERMRRPTQPPLAEGEAAHADD